VTGAELPALEQILDDPRTPQGVRVALLAELERRGLFPDEALPAGSRGEARWLALLQDDATTGDLVVAIRAAGQDPRPAVQARLLAPLASEREEVAAAAAIALGRPGDPSVVAPLAAALEHPSSRVRRAAIRGLGRTRTAEALAALEQAGANHSDPTIRRLAAAEARKRGAQAALPAVSPAPAPQSRGGAP
jgi:HEAT repeat protein